MKSKPRNLNNLFLSLVMMCLLQACATSSSKSGYGSDPAGDPIISEEEPLGQGQSEEETSPPESAPTDAEVMYNVFAAELLGSEGDLSGAVNSYLEAAMNSDDPAIAQRATRIALAAQSWFQAAMAADRWALLAPDDMAAREAASATMLATSDYVGAELQLQEILTRNKDRQDAWALVTSLLAQAGDPAKANEILKTLIENNQGEGNEDAVFVQSQLLARMAQFQEAADLADQALVLMPERVELLTFRGRLALSLDDLDTAIELFGRAWEIDPENRDLGLAYADLLARDARADDARAVMVSMEQTPDVVLSRVLFEITAKEPEKAKEVYKEFATLEVSDPNEKAYYQGQAAEAIGETDEAIEMYGTIREGDYLPISGIRRAELIAAEGRIEEARQSLAELRALGEDTVTEQAWLTEARILQADDQRQEAFKTLGSALEEFPYSIPLLYSQSLLAAELDYISVAENNLRTILSDEPDNIAALNALGYTLADRTDRYEEAEGLIRRAYELDSTDPSIVDSMGWVAYRLGKLDEAAIFLRQAWMLDNNPEIAAHLGEVLWVMGNQDEAIEIWQAGLRIDSEHPVLIETMQRLEVEL